MPYDWLVDVIDEIERLRYYFAIIEELEKLESEMSSRFDHIHGDLLEIVRRMKVLNKKTADLKRKKP